MKEFHTYACGICKTAESVNRKNPIEQPVAFFPIPKGWKIVPLPQLEKNDGFICRLCYEIVRRMVLDEYDPEG